MFGNKVAIAWGVGGLLLGALIGTLAGTALGIRATRDVWAEPDFVDRLLDRCFFTTTVAIDAKKEGLDKVDLSGASLEACRNFIDFASENLPVSDEQKAHLRRQKEMILKNFPELAAPAAGVKLSPEERAQLRQDREFIQRNFPKRRSPGKRSAPGT